MFQKDAFDRNRRFVGGVIGLVLGLVYGLIDGAINTIVLWGIPLRVNPTSIVFGALLAGLGALVAGFITAWPRSSVKGILIGGVAIALFGVIRALVSQPGGALEYLGVGVILVSLFLPAVALALPITGLMRLAVNWYEDAVGYTGRARTVRLARVWAGLVVLGLAAGSFSQMSPDEQAALRQVNDAIRAGLAARSAAEVPAALKSIRDFPARAGERYVLSQQVDTSRDLSIAGSAAVTTVTVDVQFDNGLRLECLAGPTLSQPLCAEAEAVGAN
jgi:hypothetical protein